MSAPRRERDPRRVPNLQDPYKKVVPGYLGTIVGHTTPEDIQSAATRNVHRSNEMAILDHHGDDFEAGKNAVAEYQKKHGYN